MEIFILIMIALSVAVCFLAAKLYFLNRRIRLISKQLDVSGNRLITTELKGDSLENAVKKINLMIENNSRAKAEVDKKQAALKQAIAEISHDIRTPLTSVIGYLQLAEKNAEDEEQKTNIAIALERAIYCSKLVNDFFELSVMDSRGCEPIMEKVDVNDLLCELILVNYPHFEAKKIIPKYADPGKPVYALADIKMLTRVIQNLISNGIQYGNSELNFRLDVDEQLHLSVSNPIKEEEIDTERIFDKFYRMSKSRNTSGAGIGLYLCKQLVESMNGSILAAFADGRLTITITLDRFCL
ncbi:MAG: HAMP domain-containing histidine kinase [Lachnospiraceae bacterium]|nr:HAMP domain-containing histidine kinase [Lachnospiraceae bacterium]